MKSPLDTKIPSVSVAVIAYNEEKNIGSFLASLARQQENGFVFSEFVLISDGSTDSTVQVAQAAHIKNLKIIAHSKRKGKSARLNEVYSSLPGDIIVHADADVVFAGNTVIRDLIRPILSDGRVALTSGNAVPVQGKTFIERAINVTVYAYHELRKAVANGNNMLTVSGRLLALRASFARTIRVPEEISSNDVYVYLYCRQSGFQYRFVESAVVKCRSPQTLRDHIKQNTRFLSLPHMIHSHFSEDLMRGEPRPPRSAYFFAFAKAFFRHPIYSISIFFINRYCALQAKNASSAQSLWYVAETTKHVVRPHVLIPNATSPRNVGDQANLTMLVAIIKKYIPDAQVVIHGIDTNLIPGDFADEFDLTLYAWAVFQNRNSFVRMWRMMKLLCSVAAFKVGVWNGSALARRGTLSRLLSDYAEADYIFFLNAGSIRAKKGMSQSLNLLMQLLMAFVANATHAKRIAAPMSFGPFAHKWQEQAAASVLRRFDIVATRGDISHNALAARGLRNLLPSFDLALLFEKSITRDEPMEMPVLGITLRSWLDAARQKEFESAVIEGVVKFSKAVPCAVQPVVQVDAPEYGDDDVIVVERIAEALRKRNVHMKEVIRVGSVAEAKRAYANLDMLLGMRMHSNILAATENVPFVAIAYEHKTQDIASLIGLGEYCVSCEEVASRDLAGLLTRAWGARQAAQKTMADALSELRVHAALQWSEIFAHKLL